MDVSKGIEIMKVAEDADTLDESAMRTRYAPTCFVLLHVCAARGPRVAQQTVRHFEALRHDTSPFEIESQMLVLPCRRRPESQLPFVSVGRLDGNDIVLPSESVSKFHAYVKADASGELRLLQDGRSTNGTFVDGEIVARRGDGPATVLRPGCAVRFGNMSTVFLELEGLIKLARTARANALRIAS